MILLLHLHWYNFTQDSTLHKRTCWLFLKRATEQGLRTQLYGNWISILTSTDATGLSRFERCEAVFSRLTKINKQSNLNSISFLIKLFLAWLICSCCCTAWEMESGSAPAPAEEMCWWICWTWTQASSAVREEDFSHLRKPRLSVSYKNSTLFIPGIFCFILNLLLKFSWNNIFLLSLESSLERNIDAEPLLSPDILSVSEIFCPYLATVWVRIKFGLITKASGYIDMSIICP